MQNFVQPGNVITAIAPSGGVVSGRGVLIGTGLFGVATVTKGVGLSFEMLVEGVAELAKTSALALAAGDRVYWDDTNKVVNATATAQKFVGLVVTAVANPSATVKVKLTPGGWFTGSI